MTIFQCYGISTFPQLLTISWFFKDITCCCTNINIISVHVTWQWLVYLKNHFVLLQVSILAFICLVRWCMVVIKCKSDLFDALSQSLAPSLLLLFFIFSIISHFSMISTTIYIKRRLQYFFLLYAIDKSILPENIHKKKAVIYAC